MNNKSVVLPIAWMYRQFSCLFLYIHFFLLFNEIKPFLPNTDELKIHSAEQGVLQHAESCLDRGQPLFISSRIMKLSVMCMCMCVCVRDIFFFRWLNSITRINIVKSSMKPFEFQRTYMRIKLSSRF